MGKTAPAADSARPPESPATVHAHDSLPPTSTKNLEALNPPMTRNRPSKISPPRRHQNDQNNIEMMPFHWKETRHRYTPSQKNQTVDCISIEDPDLIPPLPGFCNLGVIVIAAAAITIHWLKITASALQPFSLSLIQHWTTPPTYDKAAAKRLVTIPSKKLPTAQPLTRVELPTTVTPLPYVHVSDKNPHIDKSESQLQQSCPVYWNVIYDPTNDRIQVYENYRVRLYRRQRNSQRFVYLRGKAENTFPRGSMIALGSWQSSCFVLKYVTPRPRCMIPRESTSSTETSTKVPNENDNLIRTQERPQKCVSDRLPTKQPTHNLPRPMNANRTAAAFVPKKSKPKVLYFILQKHCIPRLFRMAKRHLDAYYSMAEVILEQNVDPG